MDEDRFNLALRGFLKEVGLTSQREIEKLVREHPPQVGILRLRMTSMPHREIMQQADILDVVVPTVGLSVQTLAAEVRIFLGIKRRQNISGEFTVESGSTYLTLRLEYKGKSASGLQECLDISEKRRS